MRLPTHTQGLQVLEMRCMGSSDIQKESGKSTEHSPLPCQAPSTFTTAHCEAPSTPAVGH